MINLHRLITLKITILFQIFHTSASLIEMANDCEGEHGSHLHQIGQPYINKECWKVDMTKIISEFLLIKCNRTISPDQAIQVLAETASFDFRFGN